MGDLSSTPTSEFDKVDMETCCVSLSTTAFLVVWDAEPPVPPRAVSKHCLNVSYTSTCNKPPSDLSLAVHCQSPSKKHHDSSFRV